MRQSWCVPFPASTAAEAQGHWNQAWKLTNGVIGKAFIYDVLIGPDKNGTIAASDLRVLDTEGKVKLSAGYLLPIYHRFLEGKGFPPNTVFT